MSISWTSPAALWLLLVVPAVWFAARYSRTNFHARQRIVQAVARSLVLAALILAIARPVISTGSTRLSIVFLVDVSQSVAGPSITGAADRVDALTAELKPEHARVLAFGANVAVLDDTKALRAIAAADPTDTKGPVQRDRTDLDQALRQARAELLPGHLQRIVLFSDGHSTAGDPTDAAVLLAASGVRVFTEPMSPRDVQDTWVDRISVPDQIAAGSLVTAIVDVGSQRPG